MCIYQLWRRRLLTELQIMPAKATYRLWRLLTELQIMPAKATYQLWRRRLDLLTELQIIPAKAACQLRRRLQTEHQIIPAKGLKIEISSRGGRIVINTNFLLPCLLAFSVLVIAYMLVEMNKANENMSKQSEIIDTLQKEIDGLTTNLRGCDELKDYCGREKQENEKLKQMTQSQSEIIASMKEAKERESGIRDYVQRDAEDLKTRLSETQIQLDRAKYDYIKVKQENKELTQEIGVLTQEIETLKEKVFGATEELNNYRTGSWWYWLFSWGVIVIILLASCFVSYNIGAAETRRRIAY